MERAVEIARAALAQALGVPPATIQVASGRFLDLPPESPLPETPPPAHPVIAAQTTAIAEAQAREKALDRAWYPRFNLEASEYARGTGIQPDGSTGGALLAGARRVAANMPVQLEAAREPEQQATARYRAGLGTLIEVAEAQRLHTRAKIDSSLARLNVWRALLALAIAQGDVAPLVAQTR